MDSEAKVSQKKVVKLEKFLEEHSPKEEKYDVVCLIGRFQVHELTPGHEDLFRQAEAAGNRVIVFVGLSMCKATVKNPLDFKARFHMIKEKFPNVDILYIMDERTNEGWSRTLDKQISHLVGANATVLLMGSRDSFIPYYSGRYPVRELAQKFFVSGTELRKQVANVPILTKEGRAAAIATVNNQWPSNGCCDVAILNKEHTQILLGQKEGEETWRLIGGFLQYGETHDEAAIREAKEETHLDVKIVQCVGSYKVDDWRYRSELAKIITVLYIAEHESGTPEPDDDIARLKWFDLSVLLSYADLINPDHKKMVDRVISTVYVAL